VTSGSKGIGEALVETLLKEGYRVATCARNIEVRDRPSFIVLAGDIAEPDFAASLWRRWRLDLPKRRGTVRKTRITELYGPKVPFINASMAFIATAPLVRAVCEAGGMGVLGAAAMPPDVLPQGSLVTLEGEDVIGLLYR
jgi:NAD(P)-dependent dehydrogenase (short-subunit alcohol dehydrogenase family)